ncbi:hypothetical protein REISMN_01360 [Rickettsia tamurae subsp. buchneri]|uniref:Uncharacterized protein n=1 Tax=Rickettsia tamurae subsp. buchneri TaxID=1462938 RepID=A0A8E0WNG8_9RICK|nr:hypothetical protein REISMN_01360 [Rickettsia tamurae subsp. buchneri]
MGRLGIYFVVLSVLYIKTVIYYNGEFFSSTKNKLVFYAVIPNKDALHGFTFKLSCIER